MKTFDINEKIVVSIDPDSAEFAGRVFDTLSAVDKKQRGLGRAKGIASADYYDLSKSTERSMRQQIDTLFNAPVCVKRCSGLIPFLRCPAAARCGSIFWRALSTHCLFRLLLSAGGS